MEIAPAPAAGPAGSGLRLYEEVSDWEELTLYMLLEEDVLFALQPGVFSLVASDVSVESRASDLNFFSGTCSVVWWAGVLYFLFSTVVCECTWWLLTG